jgi:hypothetical protein
MTLKVFIDEPEKEDPIEALADLDEGLDAIGLWP